MIKELKDLILPVESDPNSKKKEIFFILIIAAYLCFNFFIVEKYASYPWWHSHGNDADAAYAVTAVSLLNNGDLAWVQHPGATFNSLNTLSLRSLSLIFPSYKKISDLNGVSSMYEAFDVIEKAVYAERIQALLLSMLLVYLIFKICDLFLKSKFISFLLTLSLATSYGFLMYTYWVRPELPSVIFLMIIMLSAFNCFCVGERKLNQKLGTLILIGFLSGLTVFFKMQTLTAVLVMLSMLFTFSLIYKYLEGKDVNIVGKMALAVSMINMMIFPWWSVKRPSVIVNGFMGMMNKEDNTRFIEGLVPDNYYMLVFVVLLTLFLFAVAAFFLARNDKNEGRKIMLVQAASSFNFVMLGGILSIYGVLLPALGSFDKYISNTRTVFYKMLTNIFHGTFVRNGTDVSLLTVFKKIIALHSRDSFIFGINMIYVVGLISAVCLLRVFRKGSNNKQLYFLSLCFFGLGVLMDASACFYLRDKPIYTYYLIYSSSFFTLGMAVFLSSEIKSIIREERPNGFSLAFVYSLVIFLILNMCSSSYAVISKPHAKAVTEQGPMFIYETTLSYGKPFWNIVEQSIVENRSPSLNKTDAKYLKTVPKDNKSDEFIQKALYYSKISNGNIMYISKVISSLRKAIDEDPRRLEPYMMLARTYMQVRSYKDAINVLNTASIEFPNNGILHYFLGVCYKAVGNDGMALYNARMSKLAFEASGNEEQEALSKSLLGEIKKVNNN